MGKILGVVGLVSASLTIQYLELVGIAWLFIWAFSLSYSPWIMALPLWVILYILRGLKESKKETIQERWNRW